MDTEAGGQAALMGRPCGFHDSSTSLPSTALVHPILSRPRDGPFRAVADRQPNTPGSCADETRKSSAERCTNPAAKVPLRDVVL